MAGTSQLRGGATGRPEPPSPLEESCGEDRCRLGEALKDAVEEVLERTVESTGPGEDLDPVVRDSFERISRSSTLAVARWICGEPMGVAIEAGRETWEIFGELAVRRAATLD